MRAAFVDLFAREHLRASLVAFAIAGLYALFLWYAERRSKVFSRFFSEPSSALNLAVVRIVVMAVFGTFPSLSLDLSYGSLDRALIVAPVGWGRIAPHIPRQAGVIETAYVVFLAATILAVVGLYGRLSCLVATLSGFYLLTLPQLFGKVNHSHNFILFGLILAASPCTDALSIDALRRRSSRPSRSIAYSFPLRCMMILLGLIYFFPGLWKLSNLGLRWLSPDNMRWLIASKLLESDRPSALQLWFLHHDSALAAGAAYGLVFELGFLGAIFFPKARPVAAIGGLLFHNSTWLLMNISFWQLQTCYVMFVDWERVFHRSRREQTDAVSGLSPAYKPVGALAIAGMVLTGLSHIGNGWPVAMYPAFDYRESDSVTELAIAATDRSGATHSATLSFDQKLEKIFQPDRFNAMIAPLLWPASFSKWQAAALVSVWAKAYGYPEISHADFYRETYRFNRDGRPGELLKREYVGSFN